MPPETQLIVGAIAVIFVVFGLALAWASRTSH
jgi:hypothetical protein